MKNVLKIDFAKKQIIMDRAFAKNSADTRSEEYAHLQNVRHDYPTFTVTTRSCKKNPEKESYKGLTYAYMETYIQKHDDENKTIMAEYKMLRGLTEEAEEALAVSFTYLEMKDWFLKKFPAIAEFHKKRESLLAAA